MRGQSTALEIQRRSRATQHENTRLVRSECFSVALASRERRVVELNRARPRDERIALLAKIVPKGSRNGTRDPLRLSVLRAPKPIGRGRHFQNHKRTILTMRHEPGMIDFFGLGGTQADFDLEAALAQNFQATPGHKRMGVLQSYEHAPHACLQNRLRARGSSALVRTRLKRNGES
jgi:hypothetical protein